MSNVRWFLAFSLLWSQIVVGVTGRPGGQHGSACPARAAYIPEQTLGVPRPSSQEDQRIDIDFIQTRETFKATAILAVGQPGEFKEQCCSSGRIVSWRITPTKDYNNVARVNATCSSGQQISTPLYGYNGTQNWTGTPQPWICRDNGTNPSRSLFQPDDEGVFPYQASNWLTSFLGVGNSRGPTQGAVSCPAGTRAIGIGARSSCYAILALQVVCARTNDYQDNLGEILKRNAQCSSYTSLANNTALDSPQAGNYTEDKVEKAQQMLSAPLNTTQTDCCPKGEGIANWTIALSTFKSGNYTGLIQGRCTDGTLLAAVKYGFNGTGRRVCNQQMLSDVYHYNSPKSQRYFFTSSLGTLDSFMTPTSSAVQNRSSVVCPPGQGAVGYSAASSCYTLRNVSILCGNLSESAKATIKQYGSSKADLLADSEAGVCPGGLSLQPDRSYSSTTFKMPIGKIGAWKIDPIITRDLNPGVTIYSATASSLTSACCPRGQAITAFNIWPSDNIQFAVGKVSAVCSQHLDGSVPTDSPAISYGFNGSWLNGTARFCPNATRSKITLPLLEGNVWTINGKWGFQRLMDWPKRNPGNSYGIGSGLFNLSCPAAQKPLGFAARGSCWALADFKVICGEVNLKRTLLTYGQKVGIAVGVTLGVALVSLLACMTMMIFSYKRRQEFKRRTCIASHQLFNLNAPAGFQSGSVDAITAAHSSHGRVHLAQSGAYTDDVSTGLGYALMTIEDIDCSSDDMPVAFDGISPGLEIKPNQVKLHSVDGQPIELGRGGSGVVLFGIVHKEHAAIKMVKGRGGMKNVLMEIAILERAKTNYVVRFLGYSVCPDGILLAMEYMPGGTLWHALRKSGEFQWYKRGQQAFKDICKGLYMLHNNQIAHLDVKTPNILIAEDGTCKLSDLGLGKLMRADAYTCSAEETGSFAWVGPEQILGRCGFSSDIWALSTIIWEICTLRVPSREALPADIQVPDEAPKLVVDLMTACRQEDPKRRPLIGTICDLLSVHS